VCHDVARTVRSWRGIEHVCPLRRLVGAVALVSVVSALLAAGPAVAAKKVNACTIVQQAQLETAFGNAFDTPQSSSLGQFQASCRFPAKDSNGDDLNLFLTNDVKGGIKDSIGSYFATKKSLAKVYEQATPVTGVGKEAYSAFDGKNDAALVVSTGNGVTAENNVTRGEAVGKLVLAKLK
jgi:hypothetical protein